MTSVPSLHLVRRSQPTALPRCCSVVNAITSHRRRSLPLLVRRSHDVGADPDDERFPNRTRWVTTMSATDSPTVARTPSARPALPVDAYSGHVGAAARSAGRGSLTETALWATMQKCDSRRRDG